MKFGYLIEMNLAITIREKSYIKCGGEAINRSFLKKIKIELIFGSVV